MNNISYNGFDNKVITFETKNSVPMGALVTINNAGECVQCSSGQEFIGVCVCQRNDIVSVQMGGYVECKYNGAAPNKGYARLKSAGTVYVTSAGNDESINKYKVLKVDEANKTVGFIL